MTAKIVNVVVSILLRQSMLYIVLTMCGTERSEVSSGLGE